MTIEPIEVPGFGECATCALVSMATPETCRQCASQVLTPLAPRRCAVCQQALEDNETSCRTSTCRSPDRQFGSVSAIAMKAGVLERKIYRYKYDGAYGWALIFGRLLLAHLEANHSPADVDMVVACPTFPTEDWPHELGHTELVLHYAEQQDIYDRWGFDTGDPAAIVKLQPTGKSVGANVMARRKNADLLRLVLHVPTPARVAGKRLLVYDDVFTTGSTVNEVARALRAAGAASVDIIVLARQPWR